MTSTMSRLRLAAFVLLTWVSFAGSSSLAFAPWTSHGPFYKNIKSISVSPQHSNVVYAGAFGWGVFKSTDGGTTWSNYKTGMVNTYIRSVLAISDSIAYAGADDGVYKTTNGGRTWVPVLATTNSVRALAIDKKTNALYAGSFGTGLYKSTNAGATWTSISVTDPSGLDPPRTLFRIWSIAVFGKDSLYVGGSILDIPVGKGGALFESVNGGASWLQVQYPSPAIRSSVHSIAISPTNPATSLILGTANLGVYQSLDAGISWTNISGAVPPGITLPDLHINAVGFTSSYYYAGTDVTGGFYYRSLSNLAAGWIAGAGLPGNPTSVNCIRIDPANPASMFVGTEGKGTYQSANGGQSWAVRNSGMMGTAARSIAINGNGKMLLGTDFGDGMWMSPDSSGTWTRVDSFLNADPITAFGITNNPAIIYAATYGGGVHKSIDGGQRWSITDSTLLNRFVRTLEVHPTNPNLVYAGTGNGVFETVNGGTSWFPANTGMPPSTSIRSMDMLQSDPTLIYAGSDSSYLYKSTNGGTSWTQLTNSEGFLLQDVFIRTITINQLSSNIVYVGTDSGRVYRSTNGGVNWSLLADLPTNKSVRRILIHPNNGRIFFAATFGGGVFLSVDSGSHWQTFNNGLTDQEIYTIEGSKALPIDLFAGTKRTGVFRTSYVFVEHAPQLMFIGSKAVLSDHLLSFTVSAIDSDGSIPALSAGGLPGGAVFTDNHDGHGDFSWAPTTPQIGNYSVTFIASDGTLVDSEVVSISVLDSSTSAVVNYPLSIGWDLISVPVALPDQRKSTLFPSATSKAFGYSGSYVGHDTLAPGLAYWMKFPSSQITMLGGLRKDRDTIDVRAGWNLIGSVSSKVAVAQAQPVAPVTVISRVYGYTPSLGYRPADSITPGQGYWIKVSQAGKLVLDVTGSEAAALANVRLAPEYSEQTPDGINNISFVDYSNQKRDIFFTSQWRAVEPFELPPVPPGRGFDVRFASQTSLAINRNAASAEEFPIEIAGGDLPMTMSWNFVGNSMSVSIQLVREDNSAQWYRLQGSGSLVVNEPIARAKLRLVPDIRLPVDYVLDQNFPNPFNPATVMQYYLKAPGRVKLNVYNLLGQDVADLVDGLEEAGHRSVTWRAENLASGAYMYRLRVFDPLTGALKFQSVKNMFLLK